VKGTETGNDVPEEAGWDEIGYKNREKKKKLVPTGGKKKGGNQQQRRNKKLGKKDKNKHKSSPTVVRVDQ